MRAGGRFLLALNLLICCGVSAGRADDPADALLDNWPHWRGPLANGVAPRGNPPVRWSETENVKWKVEIPGRGSSTPIVWGNQVFVLTAVETDLASDAPPVPRAVPQPAGPDGRPLRLQPSPTHVHRFLVISIDRQSGKVRWQRTATEQVPHRGNHRDHGYASGSPTTDGHRLYASFGSRGLFCYDLNGSLQWSRDLGKMEIYADYGEAVTPVVDQDAVVVVHDQLGPSAIFALDARTGQTRWKRDRDERAGWSTPLIVEHHDTTQVITAGCNRVRSYDLATGRLVWECGGLALGVVSSPVSTGGLVFCMTAYPRAALLAVRLDASGDVTGTDKIAWQLDRDTSYVPSALVLDDTLYFTKMNTAILTALDARTGDPVIPTHRLADLPGRVYASPVAAAGRIYFTARDGTTLVVKHGDRLERLALNKLDDPIDASPAIVGAQIFLRGEKHLYCIEQQ